MYEIDESNDFKTVRMGRRQNIIPLEEIYSSGHLFSHRIAPFITIPNT